MGFSRTVYFARILTGFAHHSQMIEIIAHRGASADYPENSLEAVAEAYCQRADIVEVDVRRTADGVPVLCHDRNLKRLFNNEGRLSRITTDQFKRMRILGSGTPLLLEELLAMNDCPNRIVLDIKEFGLEKMVNELICRYGWEDKITVSSFYSIIIKRFSRLNPKLETALILDKLATIPIAMRLGLLNRALLHAVNPDCLHIFYRQSNLAGAANLAESGYRVAFWTIDDPEDALQAVSAQPYGIITNRPEVMRKALKRTGE